MSERLTDLRTARDLTQAQLAGLDAAIESEEQRSEIEPKRDSLLAEVKGLEERRAALREAIGNAEEHLRRTEQSIREADIKRTEIERELAGLKRRLSGAAA